MTVTHAGSDQRPVSQVGVPHIAPNPRASQRVLVAGLPLAECTFKTDVGRCRKALGDAAAPEIRLHDLRHTHATLAKGVPVKVVSERLGPPRRWSP
jgi:integrase